MNKLKYIVLLLIATLTLNLNAQKKEITLEDAVLNYRLFHGSRLQDIQWIPDSDKYSFITKDAIKIHSVKGEKTTITKSDLGVKNIPYNIDWINNDEFIFANKQIKSVYTLSTKTSIEIFVSGADNEYLNPQNTLLAFTKENNLFVLERESMKPIAVTNDKKDSDIVNGQTVHRVEFGITKGIFWSPKGNLLAYYRKDESMVEDYPIVNISTRQATLEPIKYPMAGMKSHEVTLVVYDTQSKEKIVIKTGLPKEQYLTNIAWSPDQKYIYIAILNRAQNHVKLNQYNPKTGDFIKTILEEKNKKYVQPLHKMEFISNTEFLWRSEKDGFDHFYRYNTNGKLLNQVTKGNWAVMDFISLDKKYVYFSATANNGLDRVIYKSRLNNSKSQLLTTKSGVHHGEISSNNKYILDSWSNLENPTTIDIISTSGDFVKNVFSQENPLKNLNIGKIKLGKITANDNKTKLNTRIIYPANFDENKKYPALIYVYNGPGVQLLTNSWMARSSAWMPYFANKNYIIFTVDGRGSENRGLEFEQITFHHLGDIEMQDQIKGVEYLKSLPYINPNRIAVHGWSYGGFMTTNLMTSYPNTFTTGVAGGSVIDWKWYEIMYGERYMGTPENNPKGYESSSLIHKAKNLKGKLMLIHGDIDPVVVMQHSLNFVKQCVDDDIAIDFFTYPRHEHNVRGKNRVHLMRKVLDYIEVNNQ